MSSLTPIRSKLDLERRLARLESVISVDASGNVLIHSTGSIRITGARNVDITADAVISVNGGCSLSIQAPSVSIKADADASMQGAMLEAQRAGAGRATGRYAASQCKSRADQLRFETHSAIRRYGGHSWRDGNHRGTRQSHDSRIAGRGDEYAVRAASIQDASSIQGWVQSTTAGRP